MSREKKTKHEGRGPGGMETWSDGYSTGYQEGVAMCLGSMRRVAPDIVSGPLPLRAAYGFCLSSVRRCHPGFEEPSND